MSGMRQSELARKVGISASYLNLIEHNRRRIGGKLLVDIAQVLRVEPSLLSEGAEAATIAVLREAAENMTGVEPELDRIDEFAGRFPGWAELVAVSQKRIDDLERVVATLTDRLTHDSHLASSMHELLTMVTAIRSTAGILAETDEIEPEWRNRFQRNLNEDSKRLAESTEQLVSYLDGAGSVGAILTSPMEEVEAMLAELDPAALKVETGAVDFEAIVEGQPILTSQASRDMAVQALRQLRADALDMPEAEFAQALSDLGFDLPEIARRFRVSMAAVFRRLALLSDKMLSQPVGLVVCDGSGTLMFRKPIEGFPVPRFSAVSPKWPLFQALNRPLQPIHKVVVADDRDAGRFDCYAIAETVGSVRFNEDPLYHSFMLVVPVEGGVVPASGA